MLPDGALAKISFCSFQDFNTGDIAVFKSGEGFVCHRVFRKIKLNGAPFLKTRADVAYDFDTPTAISRILGKVIGLKIGPFLVRMDNLITRITGLMVSCCLPVILRPFLSLKPPVRNGL